MMLAWPAMNSTAADRPSPIWTVDLKPLGYKPNACMGQKTTLRFWHQYLVVGTAPVPLLGLGPKTDKDIVEAEPYAPVTLVFDISNKKIVSPDVIAHADWEPLPENSPLPGWDPSRKDESFVQARWKDMAIIRDNRSGDMFLQKPGRERVLLYTSSFITNASFAGPDQILIRRDVLNETGRRKFTLKMAGDEDVLAFDKMGTRLATRRLHQSFGRALRDFGSEGYNPNLVLVQVFSSENGSQLFRYEFKSPDPEQHLWGEPWTQYNRTIALSEDGTLLALVQDSKLLVFQLPVSGMKNPERGEK